jgi:hypothetical protein
MRSAKNSENHWVYSTLLFCGIECTLDTAIHDNFYFSYVQLHLCHGQFCSKSLEWDHNGEQTYALNFQLFKILENLFLNALIKHYCFMGSSAHWTLII